MTSNVGASVIKNQGTLGFGRKSEESDFAEIKRRLKEEMDKQFRPEFINRLDEIIVFRPLTKEDISKIVYLEINAVARRLYDKEIQLTVLEPAVDFLIEKGYSREFGARPLRRAVEQFIEDPIAEEILRGTIPLKTKIEAFPDDKKEKLLFRVAGDFDPKSKPPKAPEVAGVASGGSLIPPAGPKHGGGMGGARGASN
jgi:ATP-dependent Clp protease ATP-binding subunit ClpC